MVVQFECHEFTVTIFCIFIQPSGTLFTQWPPALHWVLPVKGLCMPYGAYLTYVTLLIKIDCDLLLRMK